MTLEFCPIAVQLDMYAVSLGPESIIGCILRSGARLLSLISPSREVTVRLTNVEPEEETYYIRDDLNLAHSLILRGSNITIYQKTGVPLAMLLVWRFGMARGFLEVYTSLKRAVPSCTLTIDQAMSIPLDYGWYQKHFYLPPPELLSVRRSILQKGNS